MCVSEFKFGWVVRGHFIILAHKIRLFREARVPDVGIMQPIPPYLNNFLTPTSRLGMPASINRILDRNYLAQHAKDLAQRFGNLPLVASTFLFDFPCD